MPWSDNVVQTQRLASVRVKLDTRAPQIHSAQPGRHSRYNLGSPLMQTLDRSHSQERCPPPLVRYQQPPDPANWLGVQSRVFLPDDSDRGADCPSNSFDRHSTVVIIEDMNYPTSKAHRLSFLVSCCVASCASGQTVLFDAMLGTTPSSQGWQFIADPLFTHSVTPTLNAGYTRVDSLDPKGDRGGYFSENPVFPQLRHPDMPEIDRINGYTVRFDVRVNVEDHVMGPAGDDNEDGLEDRAGFSVIAISEDLRGLELGFWPGRIWAQDDDGADPNDLFTQAEGVEFDTTAAILQYELRVLGDAYQLVVGGGVAPRLSGGLRNYTNFMGSLDPYEIPSFLFFGDDTTRAEAQFDISYISIDSVPDALDEADALRRGNRGRNQQRIFRSDRRRDRGSGRPGRMARRGRRLLLERGLPSGRRQFGRVRGWSRFHHLERQQVQFSGSLERGGLQRRWLRGWPGFYHLER